MRLIASRGRGPLVGGPRPGSKWSRRLKAEARCETGPRLPNGYHSSVIPISARANQFLTERDTQRAMSQENVEIVRRMYDAYNRGDFESALADFAPDVEWSDPPDNPGGRTWHGPEGVQGALATWQGAWQDFRYEIQELIDCDGD